MTELSGELPKEVESTLNFFRKNHLWYRLSKNQKAFSCKDAARKRHRLGITGIPLKDELKTILGAFINQNGDKQLVATHCRGNDMIDMKRVQRVLNSQTIPQMLDKKELKDNFSAQYGTVNPFVLDPRIWELPIIQLFDKNILNHSLVKTMMTNAGHLEWGIEFKPDQLISRIKFGSVEDISSSPQNENQIYSGGIGIISGTSPILSSMFLRHFGRVYRTKVGNNFYGNISYPPMYFESVPSLAMAIEIQDRWTDIWDNLFKSLQYISRGPAAIRLITIISNSVQYFNQNIEEYCQQSSIKYISLSKTLNEYLERNNISSFSILSTMEQDWSGYNFGGKFEVHWPDSSLKEDLAQLSSYVMMNGIDGKSINRFRFLLKKVESPNIVIANDQLSLLLENQSSKQKSAKNYIDTVSLLTESLSNHCIPSS